MKKIRCVIIDDEAIARTGLATYVRKIDVLDLCGIFKNALDANDFLQKNEVDLLFLDIEMPQLNGLQFLRIFNKNIGVIFTTAYAKFALESFDFNVIDYLLKPISFDRFLQGVNKAVRYFGDTEQTDKDDFLFVKEGSTIHKITLSDIDFMEAMQNYVRIFLNQKSIMVLMPLKEFVTQLPAEQFVQTHRSFFVNLAKINRVEEEKVWFGTQSVPISKRNRSLFLKKLKNYKLI